MNHVTDNAFFTPTQYGFADCAALLGLPKPSWTGAPRPSPRSRRCSTSLNAAIAANSDGIATTVVAATAFVEPDQQGADRGHPGRHLQRERRHQQPDQRPGLRRPGAATPRARRSAPASRRGMKHGDTASASSPSPASLNIQPRLDGANAAILAAGKGLKFLHTAGFDSGRLGDPGDDQHPGVHPGQRAQDPGRLRRRRRLHRAARPALEKYGLVGKVSLGRLRPGAADPDRDQGRPARLHHRPVAVPAGLPADPVPVPVPAVRRPGLPAGDRHRPEVRGQGQRRSLHLARHPVRGLHHRREATSSAAGAITV